VEREVVNYTLEAARPATAAHRPSRGHERYSVEMAKASLVMAPFDSGYDLFVSKPPKPLFGMGGRTIGQDGIELLVGEVEDWIPRKFTNVPYLAQTTVPNEAEWILVRENPASPAQPDPSGATPTPSSNERRHRCHLIARESTSPNKYSQPPPTHPAQSPQGALGLLPETANGTHFKFLSQGWNGFDSLYALIKLPDGYPNTAMPVPIPLATAAQEGAPPAGLHSNLVSDRRPSASRVPRRKVQTRPRQ
jgi:hypothetical protein